MLLMVLMTVLLMTVLLMVLQMARDAAQGTRRWR
jgi:hypothetical protein